MAVYPVVIDAFPSATQVAGRQFANIDGTGLLMHQWMGNVGDAIEALEAVVGITGSTDTASLVNKVVNTVAGFPVVITSLSPNDVLHFDGTKWINAAPTGGSGIVYQGAWNSGTTYAFGDSVSGSNGTSYVSRVAGNVNNDPTTSPTQWQILAHSNTIVSGVGAPTSGVGSNGDFYIDTLNVALYGPKAAGAWPSGINLIGTSTGSKLSSLPQVTNPTGAEFLYCISSGVSSKILSADVAGLAQGGNVETLVANPTYTILATDAEKTVVLNAACAITIPATLPAGFVCAIASNTAGTVTIAAGAGVIQHSFNETSSSQTRTLAGRYAEASIAKTAENGAGNEFRLAGQFT